MGIQAMSMRDFWLAASARQQRTRATSDAASGVSWCRAFNSSHVRARCNLAVEEFKRGRGGKGGGKGKAARASAGEGDELAEGGDLEEQVAAAAAAEVCAFWHRPTSHTWWCWHSVHTLICSHSTTVQFMASTTQHRQSLAEFVQQVRCRHVCCVLFGDGDVRGRGAQPSDVQLHSLRQVWR